MRNFCDREQRIRRSATCGSDQGQVVAEVRAGRYPAPAPQRLARPRCRPRPQLLATSLYDDPAAELHEDASARLREHPAPRHGAERAVAPLLTVATDSSGCRRPSPMTKGRRFTASCRGPRSDHPFERGPDELMSTRPGHAEQRISRASRRPTRSPSVTRTSSLEWRRIADSARMTAASSKR